MNPITNLTIAYGLCELLGIVLFAWLMTRKGK